MRLAHPVVVKLRLNPFERAGMPTADGGPLAYCSWFVNEYWRFVCVRKAVAEAAQTLIDFPPM